MDDIQDHVHDFKEYLEVGYIPPHWGPVGEKDSMPVRGEM
jgi:hypothetical protein